MKKIFIAVSIGLLLIILTAVFLYVRYVNLDTYTWDTDNQMLILGKKKYKVAMSTVHRISNWKSK